jgi:predicted DNA repair protein MutK
MSLGLIALLDDVAAIARMAAASLDDVAAQSMKAGTKAAGIVIDDAAVTPGYVVGFSPARELPMIGRIALGSLRNKLLILLPGALLLDAFAPWALTPLLMIGGLYLVYEGAEKVYEKLRPDAAHAHEAETGAEPVQTDPHALEESRVRSAIKTDFILSAEIMALTLATVAESGLVTQALVLAVVGVLITVAVYGAVALIVKADDAGLRLVRRGGAAAWVGRLLVRGMPRFLAALTVVGTAAMLWVGGGILVHGLAHYGIDSIEHALHAAGEAVGGGLPGWAAGAAGSGVLGLAVGFALIPAVGRAAALFGKG